MRRTWARWRALSQARQARARAAVCREVARREHADWWTEGFWRLEASRWDDMAKRWDVYADVLKAR